MERPLYYPVKGYEGFYEISRDGVVKSVARIVNRNTHKKGVPISDRWFKEETVKRHHLNKGYPSVQLYKGDRKSKLCRIHRLLAEIFIPNPNNLPFINHKNGNKADFRIENLEWCSAEQNVNHAYANGLTKRRHGKENKCSKPVNHFSLNGTFIKEFESISDAEKQTGIKRSVGLCCQGKQRSGGGYIWRYKL